MLINNLNKIIQLMFSPEEATIDLGKLSVNDMVDELSKDDVIDEGKKEDLLSEEDQEKKPEDEKEEEIELEPEIKDEDLDQLEDVPRKDILAKYPTLFKDFPQLEKAYYREKKYAELLPTLDDAKEAVEKAKNYEKFEQIALSGDLNQILGSIKSSDEKAFNRIVDNYLPQLHKVDQGAFYHVVGSVINNTIVAMIQEAEKIKNDDLKAAAVILNQFITGTTDFKETKSFGPNKLTENEDKTNTERAQFHQERFEVAVDELSNQTNNIAKSTIGNHIDPKNVMTDYVKRNAIREAIDDLESSISSDARFKSVLDKLWANAAKNGFKKSDLDIIKKTWTSKAKTLLPAIIQRHRSEALKGLGKKVNDEKEEVVRKGPITQGQPATAKNSSKDGKVPANMKSLDYLMMD